MKITKVIDSGPNRIVVQADDGNQYTVNGTVAWRGNNPGNIRPGNPAIDAMSIGTQNAGNNGKFLVFPDKATGEAAREHVLFNTYGNSTLANTISHYAPYADNNNPAAYTATLAQAAGVTPDTLMKDMTPAQRSAILTAQRGVEDNSAGQILDAQGNSVDQMAFAGNSGSLVASGAPGLSAINAAIGLRGLGSSPSVTAYGNANSARPVQLASGNYIQPGVYNQGDHSVQVSDAGDGTAKITRVTSPFDIPGIFNANREMSDLSANGGQAQTMAQGYINKLIPQGFETTANSFADAAPQTVDNLKNSAVSAAQGLGSSLAPITSAFGGLGSLFSGFAPSSTNASPSWWNQAFPAQRQPAGLGALSAGGAYGAGMPVRGLAALQASPLMPLSYSAPRASFQQPQVVPSAPIQPAGAAYLGATGMNTSDLSPGQVQNALMASITGHQRGSFGAGNV